MASSVRPTMSTSLVDLEPGGLALLQPLFEADFAIADEVDCSGFSMASVISRTTANKADPRVGELLNAVRHAP
jgi:hypothetical protein